MWWKKKPAAQPTLRDQLIEAREALERQISNLDAGPGYMITPDAVHGRSIRSSPLKEMLADIEDQIAALDADDAQASDQPNR